MAMTWRFPRLANIQDYTHGFRTAAIKPQATTEEKQEGYIIHFGKI
jgi:hypothetical protein